VGRIHSGSRIEGDFMQAQATHREGIGIFEDAPSTSVVPKIGEQVKTRLLEAAVGGLVIYWAWTMFWVWAGFFQQAAATPSVPLY
jgi:hypothetical protein